MIANTGKEDAEEICEFVKEGKVEVTEDYKYQGIWLNKSGNCHLQIQKVGEKIKGQIKSIKALASYGNVGSTFVNVRLQLYESCIIPALLYNLEGWNKLSKSEVKKLEQIQSKALVQLLEIPRSTPYIGLMNEIGMWKVEERLRYRKIMLYHNIMTSNNNRLCKRIIVEQEENEEMDTFCSDVKNMMDVIGIEAKVAIKLQKSVLKGIVKEKIDNRMKEIVISTKKQMKKLRFVKEPVKFQKKHT